MRKKLIIIGLMLLFNIGTVILTYHITLSYTKIESDGFMQIYDNNIDGYNRKVYVQYPIDTLESWQLSRFFRSRKEYNISKDIDYVPSVESAIAIADGLAKKIDESFNGNEYTTIVSYFPDSNDWHVIYAYNDLIKIEIQAIDLGILNLTSISRIGHEYVINGTTGKATVYLHHFE